MSLWEIVFIVVGLSVAVSVLAHGWQRRQERQRELEHKLRFFVNQDDFKPKTMPRRH